jgi:hypothetical protein
MRSFEQERYSDIIEQPAFTYGRKENSKQCTHGYCTWKPEPTNLTQHKAFLASQAEDEILLNVSIIIFKQFYLQKNIYEEKCSKIPLPSTNSCAMKPAAASMARRPFCSSLVCIISNSSGSLGFKPSGSKPMSPGV